MEDRREVSTAEAQEFARRYDLLFAEVTAVNTQDIEDLFQESVEKVYERILLGSFDQPHKMAGAQPDLAPKKKPQNQDTGCC